MVLPYQANGTVQPNMMHRLTEAISILRTSMLVMTQAISSCESIQLLPTSLMQFPVIHNMMSQTWQFTLCNQMRLTSTRLKPTSVPITATKSSASQPSTWSLSTLTPLEKTVALSGIYSRLKASLVTVNNGFYPVLPH